MYLSRMSKGLCMEFNQRVALCIFSIFRHYTSTCFGLASCPSSGSNNVRVYMWQLERDVRFSWQSTKPHKFHLLHIYVVTSWWWATSKPETRRGIVSEITEGTQCIKLVSIHAYIEMHVQQNINFFQRVVKRFAWHGSVAVRHLSLPR
jgi:hypothetical protein